MKNLTGKKFGRLTAVKKIGIDKRGQAIWLCKCECGNTIETITNRLTMGKTKSCGCLALENKRNLHITHGKSHTRLNSIYRKMKQRCYNPHNPAFKYYGGKGILICEEWLKDFDNFYYWAIQNGYNDSLSIDRIDVNGNYEPQNCRWADDKTQARNTTHCRYVRYKGETKTLSEWCEVLCLNYATINQRLNKLKWSVQRAFETPTRGLSCS